VTGVDESAHRRHAPAQLVLPARPGQRPSEVDHESRDRPLLRSGIADPPTSWQFSAMSDQGEGRIPVRRYEDAEVRQLLERATRAQTSAPARRQTPGLTLAELEDIAAEAHIDVARLRAAAHELELERTARPAGAAARLAGGPLRMRVERVLPFEVDEALRCNDS
jgi:hypothetical protein